MQSEKFPELERRVSQELQSQLGKAKEHAEHFAAKAVEDMKASGQALELSDDEVRMLKAYRGFIGRSQPGMVFSWKSPDASASGITLPSDVSLIRDPQEVS